MTACPKCHSTNVHSDKAHQTVENLHRTGHVAGQWPLIGAVMLVTTALHAMVMPGRRHCGNCKHSF